MALDMKEDKENIQLAKETIKKSFNTKTIIENYMMLYKKFLEK